MRRTFLISSSVAVIKFTQQCETIYSRCDSPGKKKTERTKTSKLLFIGTGSSVGTPHPYYLLHSNGEVNVSVMAAEGNPVDNKNYRCNPSILLKYLHDDNESKNIIFDVGKTFRESFIRWFPRHDIQTIDSIILTHGHADAIFGLDDIRGFQKNGGSPIKVYLSEQCLKTVEKVFFYLFPTEEYFRELRENNRFVSHLDWTPIAAFQSFYPCNLKVTPIPVMHGENLVSFGFIIGGGTNASNKQKILYISDISRMLPETLDFILKESPVDILIIDALFMDYKHPTHYSVADALALCRIIKPHKTFLVGMSGELEHEETNRLLKKYLSEEGIDIQLAYDGLCLDVDI